MMESTFPKSVIVTEQLIDLSHLTEKQREHYRHLAEHVASIYTASGKERFVIGIGGPSGSGKSVTAEILRLLISQKNPDFALYTADIDAFHYRNDHLHNAKGHDGKKLHTVKGRHDTYDTGALAKKLEEFVSGNTVDFPCYSRKLHEPIQHCYTPKEGKALMILAGLWLLYDHPYWERVRRHIGYTFLIHGDSETMRHHTVRRHVRGGRTQEEAEIFYATSDHVNLKELEKSSVTADELLPHHEEVVSFKENPASLRGCLLRKKTDSDSIEFRLFVLTFCTNAVVKWSSEMQCSK
jgi:pantothenate kinase